MHSSIFVVLNRAIVTAIPGAPAARDGRSLALWASVNLFTKGAGMASTAPSVTIEAAISRGGASNQALEARRRTGLRAVLAWGHSSNLSLVISCLEVGLK